MFGDAIAPFFGLVILVGLLSHLREDRGRKQQYAQETFHNDFSMGMASGGSTRNSVLGHFGQRLANGLLGGRLDGDYERQIAPVLAGQLQHRFQADVLPRQHPGELGDDARAVRPRGIADSMPSAAASRRSGLYSPSRSCAKGETRSGLPQRISRATRIRSLTTATPVGAAPAPRP